MRIEDVDTPFVMVDLDALEANLVKYHTYYKEHGIGFRPHIKTHKTLAISRMQLEAGAVGITCQKLGEAEVMINGGLVTDILIPYNIIGKQKLERLTALVRRAPITVAVDSEYTALGLSEAASADDVTIGVIIEVEMGFKRTGVATLEGSLELAKVVDGLPGLELKGFMGFPTPPSTRALFQEMIALLDKSGLPHPIVSGGGTGSALLAHEIPELTEYRAGEYLVGGQYHLKNGTHTVEQCSLRAVSTVISRPADDRMFLDAGSKTLSASAYTDGSMGHIVEYPDAIINDASEEHGHVDISACASKPEIGERIQIIPAHPCPCVNEHDELIAVRNGRVEAVWPVHARGKIR
jgi:D-serine deaminase-like pyridoxal phosphate-dependent protein